jgi:hypothetical protein
MTGFESWGKVLIIIGVIIAISGVVMMFWQQIPLLDRLPGDIFVQKGSFQFFFPIVTCIIFSIVLTLVLNLIFRFLGK